MLNKPIPVFNPKLISFIKKDNSLLILSVGFYGIIPLLEKEKIMFLLVGLFLLMIGIFLQSIFHKDWSTHPVSLFIRVVIRMLCFLGGILFFAALIIRIPNYHITFEIAISWALPLILLIGTVEFLMLMIFYIGSLDSEQNRRKRLFSVLLLLVLYIVAYAFSGISFSYGYTTLLGTVEGKGIEDADSFYLSFLITNTLPVSDDSLLEYIELINTNNNLRAYQYFHIYTNRFIELTIVAIIFKMLLDLFNRKKVQ